MDFLEIADVRAVMQEIQVSNIPLALVGGQAVNFWAFHYSTGAPEWQEHTPYASRDIDFLGCVGAAEQVAKVLGGKITHNENMEDGVSAAVVTMVQGGKTIFESQENLIAFNNLRRSAMTIRPHSKNMPGGETAKASK